MVEKLILPLGVRLPERKDLSGTETERNEVWTSIQSANLHPGYVIRPTSDPAFGCFAEANVHAEGLWTALAILCRRVLGERCRVLMNDGDSELEPLGECGREEALALLGDHVFQLSHDGWLQFGLVSEEPETGCVSGVIVTATKHLQIWCRTSELLRSAMAEVGIEERATLVLLSGFPVVLEPIPDDHGDVVEIPQLMARLSDSIAGRQA